MVLVHQLLHACFARLYVRLGYNLLVRSLTAVLYGFALTSAPSCVTQESWVNKCYVLERGQGGNRKPTCKTRHSNTWTNMTLTSFQFLMQSVRGFHNRTANARRLQAGPPYADISQKKGHKGLLASMCHAAGLRQTLHSQEYPKMVTTSLGACSDALQAPAPMAPTTATIGELPDSAMNPTYSWGAARTRCERQPASSARRVPA